MLRASKRPQIIPRIIDATDLVRVEYSAYINANGSNPYRKTASLSAGLSGLCVGKKTGSPESRTQVARARYECSGEGAYFKGSWFIKVATVTGCILFKEESCVEGLSLEETLARSNL